MELLCRERRNSLKQLKLTSESCPKPTDGSSSSSNRRMSASECAEITRTVWINGKSTDRSYLKHVRRVFELVGYRVHDDEAIVDFDVLWNHEFPFFDPKLRAKIDAIEGFRLVNHVPGSGYYTSKVELASLQLDELNQGGIPKAFALPARRDEFLRYAGEHPQLLWVQKSNAHRGVRVLPVDAVELSAEGTFVQQFVHRPLLIDGRKFDLGVYTVVTSLSPLRVYIYDADILLRFCSADYDPFDARNVNTYVIGDDYTPLWEMPSFTRLYRNSGLSFKRAFDLIIRRNFGRDAEAEIHAKIRRIIRKVFETQNAKMRESMKAFSRKDIFFELSRFDFVIDEDFNVFLMEANMSPNLSSAHFADNRFLYENLLFDVLSLVGVGQRLSMLNRERLEDEPVSVSERQLAIHSQSCEDDSCECGNEKNSLYKNEIDCALCAKCMSVRWRRILRQTYNEHMAKRGMRRVAPPTRDDLDGDVSPGRWATRDDLVLIQWLRDKCAHTSATFC